MKKRFLSALLAGAMAVTLLAGCGGSSTPAAGSSAGSAGAASSAAKPSSEGLKVGFCISLRDQFLTSLEQAILKAGEEQGAEVNVFDAEGDIGKQLDQIKNFATQGYDAVIVNIVSTDSGKACVEAAGDMPIVFVNRFPDGEDYEVGKVAKVGSDNALAGQLQGEFLSEFFKDSGKKDLRYVMMMGTLGLTYTTDRTENAKSALEAGGFTLEKAFEDTADYDRLKAMQKMEQFLGTGKEFDVVICNNDEMALGVIEAMSGANLDVTKIPVVGIDATETGRESIKRGEMACSVFQNATGQGAKAMEVAVKYAKGETSDAVLYYDVPFELVTADNVADYDGK